MQARIKVIAIPGHAPEPVDNGLILSLLRPGTTPDSLLPIFAARSARHRAGGLPTARRRRRRTCSMTSTLYDWRFRNENRRVMNDNAPQFSPPTLVGTTVELQPLRKDHAPALLDAAADGQLWNMKVTVIPGPETVDQYIAVALEGQQAGTVMPFVIVRRDTGSIVGSTRFWKIDRVNRKLEIGHTWLSQSVQRSGVNTEAKLLLLIHAFEVMQFVRVQFSTDELNEKSRQAILRIGAKQEGIVRHERIMPDGRKRNSVRFSIIDSEWPDVKARLQEKVARQR
jgi:N-acetyltransferase